MFTILLTGFVGLPFCVVASSDRSEVGFLVTETELIVLGATDKKINYVCNGFDEFGVNHNQYGQLQK